MRAPALHLPLALAILALLSAAPTACTAPSPTPNNPRLASAAAPPVSWVRPPFAPPQGYRLARVKRQATAPSGNTSGQTGDTGTVTTSGGAASQVTTTPASATTTTQPAQQPTTQPATTTSPQTSPTDAQQQTTSPTQTTSPPATTTPDPSTSSSPGVPPSSEDQLPVSSSSSTATSQSTVASFPTVGSSSAESSSSSKSTSMTMSDVTSTYTSTFTNSDGSIRTATGTQVTQSSVPVKNSSSSSSTGKTWGIIGGVVGGVVVVAALVFVAYRMTQRRFSSIDDDDVEFKWPELQPDGQTISTNTSTLKPLETHRSGAHGVGDDGDHGSEYGGASAGDVRAAGALYVAADRQDPRGGYADPYASNSREASYEALAMADGGAAAYAQGYDPYPGGPIHATASAPHGLAAGLVYPPSPPQYRSSPSAGISPYAPQGAFGAAPYPDENAHAVLDGGAAAPMGAPGAGGAASARSTAAAVGLPHIARSESPFQVPGLDGHSSELYDDEKGAERRPL
ncbi:hypothetical protein JCM3770_001562 [Rhodotorula araucariae]